MRKSATRATLTLLAAASLGLAPAATAATAAKAPVPATPDKLVYGPFAYVPPSAKAFRTQLKAGPVAYVAEDRELPLVNIALTLKGGTYLNPAGKEGLAETAGYLLARGGTKSRTAEELEERLAFLAANLNSSFGDDRGTVSLNLLSKDLDEGLKILREVLTEPRFQESRLKLRKDQVLNDMKSRNDDSADIEGRERGFLMTGEDFYTNRYSTKASVEGITRDDLVAFHQKWFDPRNFTVALSGDVSKAEATKKLEALFADWPIRGEAAPDVPKPRQAMPAGLFLVDKDVNQGRVSVMLPTMLRTDPDSIPAAVMNDILGGGGFTSRITNRVRSDEGLAYSAGSGLTGGTWYPGFLRASFQSKVRTCAYASDIVLEEMKRIREAPVTDEELETAKKSFTETLPRRFATKAQTLGILVDEEYTGRFKADPDYYAKYAERVGKVTKEDVQRVAKRLLATDKATILAVGKVSDMLNPEPKHPVKFAELAGGKVTELPLRDPYTMKPLPKATPAAPAAAPPATAPAAAPAPKSK